MSLYAYVHIRHTHLYHWSAPSCYSSTTVFNDCYSELMPYTRLLTLSELVVMTHINVKATPINDNNYNCHNKYNSYRTCLTNHMGSISRHITPLVTNSLGDGYTQTHTHTHTRTHTHTYWRSAQDQFVTRFEISHLPNYKYLEIPILIIWSIVTWEGNWYMKFATIL